MMEIDEIHDVKVAIAWIKACGEYTPVLHEVRMHVFRGATLWMIRDGQAPVSFNVTKLGKRRKNVWEPYANWYTAYTVEARRREGLAKRLARHVRNKARRFGCRRLKSLVGTHLGLLLHASLGDQFWGLRDTLEVVVDTPIVDLPEYAERPPPMAVADRVWTLDAVLKELAGRKLRYDQ